MRRMVIYKICSDEGLSVHYEEMVSGVLELCTKGIGEGGLKAPRTGTSGTMTGMMYET